MAWDWASIVGVLGRLFALRRSAAREGADVRLLEAGAAEKAALAAVAHAEAEAKRAAAASTINGEWRDMLEAVKAEAQRDRDHATRERRRERRARRRMRGELATMRVELRDTRAEVEHCRDQRAAEAAACAELRTAHAVTRVRVDVLTQRVRHLAARKGDGTEDLDAPPDAAPTPAPD